METGMNFNKRPVSFRPLLLSGLLPGVALSMGCKEEPQGRFVLVEQGADQLELPPDDLSYELTHSTFAECPLEGWDQIKDMDPDSGMLVERAVSPETRVVRAAYDTLTDDGYTLDSAVITALSRTLDGRDTTRCGPDGAPPEAPMFCDAIADGTTVVDPATEALLCDPWWRECFAAMSGAERSGEEDDNYSLFFYVNDIRYTPLPSDEVQAQCTCSSERADVIAAHDVMEASYDWNLYYNVLYGDATITIQNDAPSWGPQGDADNENGNAGICGAWLFSDAGFKALDQADEEGEASALQNFCGGIPVRDIASAEQTEVQPLTTLWLGRTNADRSLRLGGYGDLVNAWVLAGRDDNSRVCPTCKPGRGENVEDSCSVSTGAARLIFGEDFRYRASSQSGSLHLLMAECSPRVDSVELGWQQACWHAEIPQSYLESGSHTLVKVGGFGPTVARDVSVLDNL